MSRKVFRQPPIQGFEVDIPGAGYAKAGGGMPSGKPMCASLAALPTLSAVLWPSAALEPVSLA